MEPRQEERKDKEPRTETKEGKPRRFRIVKLEERIAPSNGYPKKSIFYMSCVGGGGFCSKGCFP
jgi:hypothetical protein